MHLCTHRDQGKALDLSKLEWQHFLGVFYGAKICAPVLMILQQALLTVKPYLHPLINHFKHEKWAVHKHLWTDWVELTEPIILSYLPHTISAF